MVLIGRGLFSSSHQRHLRIGSGLFIRAGSTARKVAVSDSSYASAVVNPGIAAHRVEDRPSDPPGDETTGPWDVPRLATYP